MDPLFGNGKVLIVKRNKKIKKVFHPFYNLFNEALETVHSLLEVSKTQ